AYLVFALRVSPFFVPNPGSLIQAKKFPAATCRYWPKQLAANLGLAPNQCAIQFGRTLFVTLQRARANNFFKNRGHAARPYLGCQPAALSASVHDLAVQLLARNRQYK